ncbi:MAG: hypothetical protein IJB74_03255 [Clostridia bacterium]|nr:hypothetical protein [Clostridia bacterium]
MKKLLCIFMAVMMMLSSVAVIGVSAADGYAAKNPVDSDFYSYQDFINKHGDKKIYGFTHDFLYEKGGMLDWTKLDIKYEKEGLPFRATPESVSLAVGNMNSLLKRVVNNYFIGDKLYTEEYAVALINFFGKLVNPYFEPVNKAFENNVTPNEYDFYEIVAEKSELAKVIQSKWCNTNIDFKSFLVAFGVDLSDVVNSDFKKGVPVAKALIQGSVNTLIGLGPLEYAIRILETLSSSYSSVLYEPAIALFEGKIARGKPVRNGDTVTRVNYSTDELKSVQGFLSYAFDGVIDYDFFKYPDARVGGSSTAPERLVYLMMYFAINYRYNSNKAFVDGLSAKITNFLTGNGRYSRAGYSYNEIIDISGKISKMIDIIFKGDITLESVNMLNNLTQENVDATPDDILTQLKSWFTKLIRKITDYIDYLFKLFTGEIKYGESIID